MYGVLACGVSNEVKQTALFAHVGGAWAIAGAVGIQWPVKGQGGGDTHGELSEQASEQTREEAKAARQSKVWQPWR